MYDAGKADGGDPFKAGVAIGHFGTFDFQRRFDENAWYPRTRDNWPFELDSNPTP